MAMCPCVLELVLQAAVLGGEGDVVDDDDGVLHAVIVQRVAHWPRTSGASHPWPSG